ncbi:MAG: YceD family protein [Actinomycetota bacterium]
MDALRFSVADLLGHPGRSRQVAGEMRLVFRVGESNVDDQAEVFATLDAVPDGVLVRGTAALTAHQQCSRCLLEWEAPIQVEFVELYVGRPAEGQLGIHGDRTIDLAPLVHDEISLALLPDPLCRPECRGLCPSCGADLNTDPCAGHGDDSSSPFAALRQLLGPES